MTKSSDEKNLVIYVTIFWLLFSELQGNNSEVSVKPPAN